MKRLIAADANLDGKVDVANLGILGSNYGQQEGRGWITGDFNGDGKVDVAGLGILGSNYKQPGGLRGWPRRYGAFVAAVPRAGDPGPAGLADLAVLRRRRSK